MQTRSVAIYARVSTEHEAQLSALENQVQYYENILVQHPEWKLYKQYIDEGITGTSVKKRKSFMEMMQDAEKGCFDLIITREVSRFARNTVDTLQETRKLKRINVEVWFVEDNIWTMNDEDGELRLTIMATLAQNESKKTSMRVKAGQTVSFKNAVPYGNGNILGYDRINNVFVINPEQAETVKQIYKLYLEGHGADDIKYEMEQRGRLTSTGKTNWHAATISHILKNPFYCGIVVYRKQFVPDYLEQKRKKNTGQVEQVVVEGTHEPIISKEDYYRVQEILRKKKEHMGSNQFGVRGLKDVWSRELVCGCGSHFLRMRWHADAVNPQYAYQCYSQTKTGSVASRLKRGLSIEGVCEAPMVTKWKMDLMARSIFQTLWSDKKKVLKIANKLLDEGYDGDPNQQENEKKIKGLQEQIQQIDKKLETLLELRVSNQIDSDMFLAKKASLMEQKTRLKKQLEVEMRGASEAEESVSREDALNTLKYALNQNFNFEGVTIPDDIIESFVERVIVYPDKFEWHLSLLDNKEVMFGQVEGRVNHPTVKIWADSYDGGKQYRQLSRKVGSRYSKVHTFLYFRGYRG